MNAFVKKWWKTSRLRFYYLNACWNLNFWLFSKRLYKKITYQVPTGDMYTDVSNKIQVKTKTVTRKRFEGYLFRNKIYTDNPGLPKIDRETWSAWKKKGLIK